MHNRIDADYVVLRTRVLAHAGVEITPSGVIGSVAPVQNRSGDGSALMPGFVDIQVNGFGGVDLQTGGGEELREVGRTLARSGVTSFCPTLISAPVDTLVARLERLVAGLPDWPNDAARPLGFHIEGPFLNPKCRGAHAREDLVAPTIAGFDRILAAAGGRVSLLTIAPELDGAPELISHAVSRGVHVALGHSAATLEQAEIGIAAGATLATHFGNAMGSFHHRAPNLIGACLLDDRLTVSIIPDGIHVHPSVLAIVTKAKTAHRVILTTDAIAAAGCPDGDYELSGRRVRKSGGECRDEDGNLAGSAISYGHGVEIFHAATGAGLVDLGLVSAANAARLLGLEPEIGTLAAGASADFVRVALDPNGSPRVKQVWIAGVEIPSSSSSV